MRGGCRKRLLVEVAVLSGDDPSSALRPPSPARGEGSYAGITGPVTSMKERRVAEGPPPPVASQQPVAQDDSEAFPQRARPDPHRWRSRPVQRDAPDPGRTRRHRCRGGGHRQGPGSRRRPRNVLRRGARAVPPAAARRGALLRAAAARRGAPVRDRHAPRPAQEGLYQEPARRDRRHRPGAKARAAQRLRHRQGLVAGGARGPGKGAGHQRGARPSWSTISSTNGAGE